MNQHIQLIRWLLPTLLLLIVLSGCTNVYGPARLGVSPQVLNKPYVPEDVEADTAATYAGFEYTRSSYESEPDEVFVNDIVNSYTARAYRSYVKDRVAFTFGGAFSLGNRTFPLTSVGSSNPDYNFYAASLFGEVALPLVQSGAVNVYPIKTGLFYTYEFGESMDYLEDKVNLGSGTQAYPNRHMPALVVSHELIAEGGDDLLIGIDLAQIFNFNARNERSFTGDSISRTFYSIRASLSVTLDRYIISFSGTTGLHSAINVGLTAKLGALQD